MISRRDLTIAALALPILFAPVQALAAEKADYSAAAFDAAQAAGKSILVEIHATWCPTCRAQAPILAQLESDAKYDGLVVFHIDFDKQKDAVRRFGARMQSTLVVFKGSVETGRSVGDTNPDSIAALLAKTL
jgi:thiol-disulfide isomerase/thioredoxin